ncbi:MAG TPA: heavy metal-associated domain-containing protein [Bacteroidia bacterium]|jgi:copper chaperone CopZ|nr:heavy metal-associated domain-containing protein [Bacteroidia bacterium]
MLKNPIICFLFFVLSLPAQAQIIRVKLNVIGLTCSACSFGTERSIRQLKFVDDVKMDLNSNIAEITFKKDIPVSVDQVVQKVYDAGFSVGKVLVLYAFTDEKLEGKEWKSGPDTYEILNTPPAALSGEKELTFVGEKYMPKKEYKQWKPLIDPITTINKVGSGSGHIYFVLF